MNFDVIVIGAGSVGTPTALFLSEAGLKVAVIEKNPSTGQGQNKAAIGGVRATHSDPAKIGIGLKSLEIFSTWKEVYGDDIGWKAGGYSYIAYREQEVSLLKKLLKIQKEFGLEIEWLDKKDLLSYIPYLNPANLLGGTLSIKDGQVSPLKASSSFARQAIRKGVKFFYNEEVIEILHNEHKINGVRTNKGDYFCETLVNAAGADASIVMKSIGLEIPIFPESHEAGISCPLAHFLKPLIVDLREGPEGKTSNFYFGQNDEGAIIFCYTPEPSIQGIDRDCTSEFLPVIARRLIDVIPSLAYMPVRRVWRGLYPMTPDGIPIAGRGGNWEGLYILAGMCGQGFMLGPGFGKEITAQITNGKPVLEPEISKAFSINRDFSSQVEALK